MNQALRAILRARSINELLEELYLALNPDYRKDCFPITRGENPVITVSSQYLVGIFLGYGRPSCLA